MNEKNIENSPKIRASRGNGGGFLDKNKYPRSKKITLTILALLLVICIVVGVSYAYWLRQFSQETSNVIYTDCLNLKFTDKTEAIYLEKAHPISDEEGEALSPYEFTIENICDTSTYYSVNLEMMDDENRLASKYVAIDFNDTGKKLLIDYSKANPTYDEDDYTAVESRALLEDGVLESGESATYSLKLWLDEDASNSESMNKVFISKITLKASQQPPKITFAKYITQLAQSDTTNLVADDETVDHNIRYIGTDPDNYLCFDKHCTNGKWRVIGLMNNIEIAEGGTRSLVKIVRAESIGNLYWDTNNINNWTTASLNTYLNETWYTSNLADYDNLIESVIWKLGGYSTSAITTSTFYAYERNTLVYGGRPTEWSGKMALIYPSDYGYATSGGDTGRDTCLTYNLGSWDSYSDCYSNDYLLIRFTSSGGWMLMPHSNSTGGVFYVGSLATGSGVVAYNKYHTAAHNNDVFPSGYLNLDTKILSGTGTSDDPWIVGLE